MKFNRAVAKFFDLDNTKYVPVVASSKSNSKITPELIRSFISNLRRDIDDLLTARNMATDPYNPSRAQLIFLMYNLLENDLHLQTLMNIRVTGITNKEFAVFNSQGEEIEEKTKTFNCRAMANFIKYNREADFFGYSVIESMLNKNKTGWTTQSIPREYYSPDYEKIFLDWRNMQRSANGLSIYDPKIVKNVFVKETENIHKLGILNQAAALAIYKRHSWLSWDTFEEIFGMPMRVGKIIGDDEELRMQMETDLENMGRAAYAVLPSESTVEIIENKNVDAYNVFYQKIRAINDEMTKLVIGGTGLTDEKAFVGSSQVHERTFESILANDEKELTTTINEDAQPFLARMGLIIGPGEYFGFRAKKPTKQELMRDVVQPLLNSKYKPDRDWLEAEFDIKLDEPEPMPEFGEDGKQLPPGQKNEDDEEKKDEGDEEKKDEDDEDDKEKAEAIHKAIIHFKKKRINLTSSIK